jgi:hypothetical protein
MPQHFTEEPNQAPPPKVTPFDSISENDATIALLERWAEEDRTEDPALIAQAERELAEFKASLNANRSPDKPIFS